MKKIKETFKTILIFSIFLGVVYGLCVFLHYRDLRNYPYGNYEMTYRVYYTPTDVKEYTITHNRPISCGSYDGINYISKHGIGEVIETTAKIEVVKYVNKDKK